MNALTKIENLVLEAVNTEPMTSNEILEYIKSSADYSGESVISIIRSINQKRGIKLIFKVKID